MKIMNSLKILGSGAIAVAVVAGCSAPVAKTPGGTVNATLTDMKIALDRGSVSAGPITFVVKNTGAVAHELVVLQTDVSQDKIAAGTAEAGKVDETGNVGETGDMATGTTNTFTVTLAAGHYVLMCNEVGHYGSGMHLAFTVN